MIEARSEHPCSPSISRGSNHPPILVIGLGNPILGDDGVGWRVAQEVMKRLALVPEWCSANPLDIKEAPVDVNCLSLGGLSLMEHLIGYERVIIIDAIYTGNYPLGEVRTFPLEQLTDLVPGHTTSVHDTSLHIAIQVGRSMGAKLPELITIVAVESAEVYVFSEELSQPTAAAVPIAVDAVMELLKNFLPS